MSLASGCYTGPIAVRGLQHRSARSLAIACYQHPILYSVLRLCVVTDRWAQ